MALMFFLKLNGTQKMKNKYKYKNDSNKKEALTKEDFLKALTKATTIVRKPSSGKKRTSGDNLSGGYSGKHTHSNKTEGT